MQQPLELGELANQLQDDGASAGVAGLMRIVMGGMVACIVKSIDIRLAPAQQFMSARSKNTERFQR
jgi:hypothetical protein